MNTLITIDQVYNFLYNYNISSSYVAILRFITCGFMVIYYLWIIHDLLLFIDPEGIFSYQSYLRFCREKYGQISLYNRYGDSKFYSYIILLTFFISGITSAIGFHTEMSLWIFLITMISVQSRIFPIIYTGGDTVIRFMVLALCLTNCNSSLSIDNIYGLSAYNQYVDGWAIRLVQLSVAFGAYFGSGLRKVGDEYWTTGYALRNALNSHLWGRKNKISILDNIFVFKFLNYFVLLFEITAPVIFFLQETCGLALLVALSLHIGIMIFMRIGFFCPVMLISLLYFYDSWVQLSEITSRILSK